MLSHWRSGVRVELKTGQDINLDREPYIKHRVQKNYYEDYRQLLFIRSPILSAR